MRVTSPKPTWITEPLDAYGTTHGFSIKSHLHHEKTPIMTIDIYDTTDFGHLMVIDGSFMVTSRDNFFYHEMMSHPVLFTHPNPEQVVIIGGGDCGTLQEVLKHPVKSVTQVEIEEKVTRLSEKYFPELCTRNNDPRAHLLFEDGIAWMKNAPSQSVDVIIVDSTDPVGPAEGLFNTAFYQQCHRVLKNDGILAIQSESPLIHQSVLKEVQVALKTAGFAHRMIVPFPSAVYPTGWISMTMASKQQPLNTFRHDEALFASLNTQYYHFPLHEAALTPLPLLKPLLAC